MQRLAEIDQPTALRGGGNSMYRFFGLTESLSWLAQFAGQGFEDISALN